MSADRDVAMLVRADRRDRSASELRPWLDGSLGNPLGRQL
jgi:hypothetical protein